MQRKADCVFCQIVAGQEPSFKVAEDELTLTFMDLFPVSHGHTLIITKEHFENLFEASEASLSRVVANSHRLAHAIRRALEPDGIGVYQLNGAAAGQTVFHYHMHLIPRRKGEGLGIHGRRRGNDEHLRVVAKQLAEALAGA